MLYLCVSNLERYPLFSIYYFFFNCEFSRQKSSHNSFELIKFGKLQINLMIPIVLFIEKRSRSLCYSMAILGNPNIV